MVRVTNFADGPYYERNWEATTDFDVGLYSDTLELNSYASDEVATSMAYEVSRSSVPIKTTLDVFDEAVGFLFALESHGSIDELTGYEVFVDPGNGILELLRHDGDGSPHTLSDNGAADIPTPVDIEIYNWDNDSLNVYIDGENYGLSAADPIYTSGGIGVHGVFDDVELYEVTADSYTSAIDPPTNLDASN